MLEMSRHELLARFRALPGYGDRQRRLFDELSEFDETMGYLYAYAFVGCYGYCDSAPDARAYLAMASHAVRELTNVLPDLVCGRTVQRNYAGEQRAREKLLSFAESFKPAVDVGQTKIDIPIEAYEALLAYRDEVKSSSFLARKRSAAALLGSPERVDSSTKPWDKAKSFFMEYVHIDREFKKPLPPSGLVLSNYLRIERSLSSSLHIFFSTKAELEEVLERINGLSDGEYVCPSEDDVLDTLSYITDENLRSVFYFELRNPKWIKPLAAVEAFRITPIDRDTGRCHYWPQGNYLEKMSTVAPSDVHDAILELFSTDNFSARSQLISIASKLPPEYVSDFAPAIAQWTEQAEPGHRCSWIDDELIELIAGLKAVDQSGAYKIATAIFMPKIPGSFFGEVSACVPEYCYAKHLQAFISGDGYSKVFGFLRRLITGFLDTAAQGMGGNCDSSYAIQDLLGSPESIEHGVGVIVATELVRHLRKGVRDYPENFAKSLADGALPIVQRAALMALALEVEEADGGDIRKLVPFCENALNNDRVFQDESKLELHKLARVCSRLPETACFDGFCDKVVHGHDSVQKKWRDQYLANGYSQEDSGSHSRGRADRWQHAHLLALDERFLTQEAKSVLRALNDKFGEVKYEDRHFTVSSWAGPKGGRTAGELLSDGPESAISFLNAWSPGERDFSIGGQVQEVGSLAGKNPSFFSGLEADVAKLRPSYCSAIINAWYHLIVTGGSPAKGMVAFCLELAKYEDGAKFEGARGGFDDYAEYFPSKCRALDLLSKIVDKAENVEDLFGYEAAVLEAFGAAVSWSNECSRREKAALGSGGGLDNVCYNLSGTLGFLGVVEMTRKGLWPELEHAGKDYIDIALSSACDSLSMAFQAGRLFGSLLDTLGAEDEKIVCLFSSPSLETDSQKIALTSALSWWRPHPRLLEILRSGIKWLILNPETEVVAPSFRSNADGHDLVGEWVDLGSITGSIGLDDELMSLWESKADGVHLGRSLANACRAVSNTDKPAEQVVCRMSALWDRRVAIARNGKPNALSGLNWLIGSGAFPIDWWSERLRESFEINPIPRDLDLIEDELVDLARFNPKVAVSVVRLAAKHSVNDPESGRWVFDGFAPQVLAEALNSGGESVGGDVEICMDLLSQLGMASLDKEMEPYLA